MNLSFRIKKTPDLVFDYLTDMQKFASVHPVITRIDRKNDNNYLVYETLKLGYLPISFTYPVEVTVYPHENTVVMKAVVMKLTTVEMTFVLTPFNDFTIIKEHISFRSPFPIHAILQRVFKKQHKVLFKNIERILLTQQQPDHVC